MPEPALARVLGLRRCSRVKRSADRLDRLFGSRVIGSPIHQGRRGWGALSRTPCAVEFVNLYRWRLE